jgi:hypothetical protein
MKKILVIILLLSIAIVGSAEIKTTWKDFEVLESLVSDDYIPKKNMVLVVAKVTSNMDIKEYFINKKFTSESAYKRSNLNSLAFLFLDITGKSKGFEVKPLFFSWDDYFIMEIPVGNYKLHSMLYPPKSKGSIYGFELNDFLNYNFTMEIPFVYIGDIKLLFDFENDFGVLEHRLLVEDNYLEAKAFLSERIKDQNGNFLVLEKELPDNNRSLVFDIEEIH